MIKAIIDRLKIKPDANQMKIYTDLTTLKNAWFYLNECKISGLMTGDPVEISVNSICDELLGNDKLHLLIEAFTHRVIDPDKLTLGEALSLVMRFFMHVGNELKVLKQMISLTTPSPTATVSGESI